MKNTFGNSLSVTLFGESHGEAIGAVIDGISPGICIDEEFIKKQLSRRRPSSPLDTARREPDNYRIVSGVFNGKTTGTPICIIIPNENTRSSDYTYGPARPSHADYAAYCKYHGFEDFRGGGHFSGRLTAALVAVGGILIPALERLGIKLGTHILKCGGVKDAAFGDGTNGNISDDISLLYNAAFPVIDHERGCEMAEQILRAKNDCDSIGGITQTAIVGLPAGLGEPYFDSVESMLTHALFGIGGIKGIEFGLGFGFADGRASELNDRLRMVNGRVITETNNNGGINGGITNGMPVVFQCVVKPTPSIFKEQETIDFIKGENTGLTVSGRHDPAIIRRICPVIDSVTAIVVADMIVGKYGVDILAQDALPDNAAHR